MAEGDSPIAVQTVPATTSPLPEPTSSPASQASCTLVAAWSCTDSTVINLKTVRQALAAQHADTRATHPQAVALAQYLCPDTAGHTSSSGQPGDGSPLPATYHGREGFASTIAKLELAFVTGDVDGAVQRAAAPRRAAVPAALATLPEAGSDEEDLLSTSSSASSEENDYQYDDPWLDDSEVTQPFHAREAQPVHNVGGIQRRRGRQATENERKGLELRHEKLCDFKHKIPAWLAQLTPETQDRLAQLSQALQAVLASTRKALHLTRTHQDVWPHTLDAAIAQADADIIAQHPRQQRSSVWMAWLLDAHLRISPNVLKEHLTRLEQLPALLQASAQLQHAVQQAEAASTAAVATTQPTQHNWPEVAVPAVAAVGPARHAFIQAATTFRESCRRFKDATALARAGLNMPPRSDEVWTRTGWPNIWPDEWEPYGVGTKPSVAASNAAYWRAANVREADLAWHLENRLIAAVQSAAGESGLLWASHDAVQAALGESPAASATARAVVGDRDEADAEHGAAEDGADTTAASAAALARQLPSHSSVTVGGVTTVVGHKRAREPTPSATGQPGHAGSALAPGGPAAIQTPAAARRNPAVPQELLQVIQLPTDLPAGPLDFQASSVTEHAQLLSGRGPPQALPSQHAALLAQLYSAVRMSAP